MCHPVMRAVAAGDARQLRKCLSDAAVNEECRPAELGCTPLHAAAIWGRSALAQTLLHLGASLSARTRKKLTPLQCAQPVPWLKDASVADPFFGFPVEVKGIERVRALLGRSRRRDPAPAILSPHSKFRRVCPLPPGA